MKTYRDISGSHVMLELGHDHYIDARKYASKPGLSFVEVVFRGHVVYKETEFNSRAPERILELVKLNRRLGWV
jgi:hypothetical protein